MPTMCMSPLKFLIFRRPWQSSPPYSAAGRQKNDSLCCVWNLPKNFFCMYCKIVLWLWLNNKEETDVIRINKSCHYLVGKFKLKIFWKNKTKTKYVSNLTFGAFDRCLSWITGAAICVNLFPKNFSIAKSIDLAIKNLSLSYRCFRPRCFISYMIVEQKMSETSLFGVSTSI